MSEAVSVGLLAATPTWATILVAVLAGLFGLFAGASAAAVVTSSHERTERFRDRIIEAASRYIEPTGNALRVLETAHFALRRRRIPEGEDTVATERLVVPDSEEPVPMLKIPKFDPALQDANDLLQTAEISLVEAKRAIASARPTIPALYILFARRESEVPPLRWRLRHWSRRRDRRVVGIPNYATLLLNDLDTWAATLEASIHSDEISEAFLDKQRSRAQAAWGSWLVQVNTEISRRFL